MGAPSNLLLSIARKKDCPSPSSVGALMLRPLYVCEVSPQQFFRAVILRKKQKPS